MRSGHCSLLMHNVSLFLCAFGVVMATEFNTTSNHCEGLNSILNILKIYTLTKCVLPAETISFFTSKGM